MVGRRPDDTAKQRRAVLTVCLLLALAGAPTTGTAAQTTDQVPCPPIRWNGRWQMSCLRDDVLKWTLPAACTLSVDVPPVPVYRRPFPRGLVNAPMTMSLSYQPVGATEACGPLRFAAQSYIKNGGNHAVCSHDAHPHTPPCGGDVKDYEVDVWWGRLETGYTERPYGDPGLPCWDWGDGRGGQCGLADQHTYQAASHTGNQERGIPILTNGPRADLASNKVMAWNQESYQVKVPTYWALYTAEAYRIAAVSFTPANRSAASAPSWTASVTWTYVLIPWRAVDLRRFGNDTWFWKSYRQYQCQDTSDGSTPFGGATCQHAPDDPSAVNTLPANVIDVQNVLCPAAESCNEQRP